LVVLTEGSHHTPLHREFLAVGPDGECHLLML